MADLVHVSFVILPEHYGQTKSYPLTEAVASIRAQLERELSIPEESLELSNLTGLSTGGVAGRLEDGKSLGDYGAASGDKLGIELRINYGGGEKGGR